MSKPDRLSKVFEMIVRSGQEKWTREELALSIVELALLEWDVELELEEAIKIGDWEDQIPPKDYTLEVVSKLLDHTGLALEDYKLIDPRLSGAKTEHSINPH